MTRLSQAIIQHMRKHLQEHKISYAELAQYLETSLSTVQRMFTQPSFSLSLEHTEKFAQMFALSMAEFVKKIEEHEFVLLFYTEAQENFLAQNLAIFEFLNELYLSIKSSNPKDLEETMALSEKDTDSFIASLISYGLLEPGSSRAAINLTHHLQPRLRPGGALKLALRKQGWQAFSREIEKRVSQDSQAFMHVRFCPCSQEIAGAFREELQLLREKYAILTRKYETFHNSPGGFLLEGGALCWFEPQDPELERFRHSLLRKPQGGA